MYLVFRVGQVYTKLMPCKRRERLNEGLFHVVIWVIKLTRIKIRPDM